jgi:hypothetical protein
MHITGGQFNIRHVHTSLLNRFEIDFRPQIDVGCHTRGLLKRFEIALANRFHIDSAKTFSCICGIQCVVRMCIIQRDHYDVAMTLSRPVQQYAWCHRGSMCRYFELSVAYMKSFWKRIVCECGVGVLTKSFSIEHFGKNDVKSIEK